MDPIDKTVLAFDWPRIDSELDAYGVSIVGKLFDDVTCQALAASYEDDSLFRSRVVMARHGFGQGEYKYFRYPLPAAINQARHALYPHAARTANRWAQMLGTTPFPERVDEMLARCHKAGQLRPTPLMLSYGPGDYNCLHQDLYGEHVFPLQLVVMLSDMDAYTGGTFTMTEQRPRMQSRVETVTLKRGEAALFAVHEKPRNGTKGVYRVKLRHGVSRVTTGKRQTLGIIFHDAA